MRALSLSFPRVGRVASRLPAVRTRAVTLLAAAWLVAVYNGPFWTAVEGIAGAGSLTFRGTLPVVAVAFVYCCLSLFTWHRATKPALAVIFFASAVVSYFMREYGVVIDSTMLQNLVQTDPAEVADLLHWKLLGWIVLLGALPSAVLAVIPVRYGGRAEELLYKAGTMAAACFVILACFAFAYQDYVSMLRTHRELRLLLVPNNMVGAAWSYGRRAESASQSAITPVGKDAARTVRAAAGGRPTLAILVVGETARAANFSLNGYERNTNPRLQMQDVVSFTRVESCGTNTATSLPCMFQSVGRQGYRDSMAHGRENLLDVLQRAGYAVLWRDNNSGCKGVCDRVQHEDLSAAGVPGLCENGDCHDEILLHGLQQKIDRLTGDAVIVLHMKGSHGPAYYRRYPESHEAYRPACRTNQLPQCRREEIVNAYDNTIRYSDHVLANVIDLLQRNSDRFDAAFFYVSDHGESLGENGLYLHGLPRGMAPIEQVRVPLIVWLSDEYRRDHAVDRGCLAARRDAPYSHDHLFHSLLGLLDVTTSEYRRELDLFSACRTDA